MPNVKIDADAVKALKKTQDLITFITQKFGENLGDNFSLTSIGIFTLTSADYKYTGTGSTCTHVFTLGFSLKIAQDATGKAKSLTVSATIQISDSSPHQGQFSGKLTLPVSGLSLTFNIVLKDNVKDDTTTTLLVGELDAQENPNIGNVNLEGLVSEIYPQLSQLFPEELLKTFKLNEDLLFIVKRVSTKESEGKSEEPSEPVKDRKVLLGIGFNENIALNKFPLISKQLPSNIGTSQFTIELLIALQEFEQTELKTISDILKKLASPLKVQVKVKTPSSTDNKLQQGLSIGTYFNIGGYTKSWLTPLKRKSSTQGSQAISQPGLAVSESSAIAPGPGVGAFELVKSAKSSKDGQDSPLTISNNGAWLTVQKSFGPIHLEKVGLVFKEGSIYLTPQIIVQVSDFTLALNGLSVSTPLTAFNPEFNLDGFGLEFVSDSLNIGGAFLHTSTTAYQEYLGMVNLGLKTKAGNSLSLSAIGSYVYFDKKGLHQGDVALFLYLAVDYPLGGPPFFFVTGLAGGFGYNHELKVPSLDKIEQFPLVAQAMDGGVSVDPNKAASIITNELQTLDKYIPISIGSGFLAVGLKFTTFKMLDSFALLTLALNQGDFQLNLLGISTLTVPLNTEGTGVDPLAVVQLALRGEFDPNEGILLVRAQLTSESYIISKDCHITGGFAVAFWFAGDHAGDFVITLGGYHPKFKVPDYYPRVPRLGLHWQLDSNTSVRGNEYFALCSHALMAGGWLALSYKSGNVWANLEVGADFLICWKPYYYDIHAYIHVSAGIGSFSAGLGVDLHIWGPDFGGRARIKVWIFSATVNFGHSRSGTLDPIGWGEFKDSFLPEADKICSIAASKGLVKQALGTSGEIWIINPKTLELVTDSLIPSNRAYIGQSEQNLGTNTGFGINPMGITNNDLTTTHSVEITHNGYSATHQFNFEPLTKQVPTGAWGEPDLDSRGNLKLPDVNATRFVENTLSGFRITPAQPPQAGRTHDIEVKYLQDNVVPIQTAYSWQTLEPFNANTSDNPQQRRDRIRNTIANNSQRNEVLEALGLTSTPVNVSGAIANSFIFAPEVN